MSVKQRLHKQLNCPVLIINRLVNEALEIKFFKKHFLYFVLLIDSFFNDLTSWSFSKLFLPNDKIMLYILPIILLVSTNLLRDIRCQNQEYPPRSAACVGSDRRGRFAKPGTGGQQQVIIIVVGDNSGYTGETTGASGATETPAGPGDVGTNGDTAATSILKQRKRRRRARIIRTTRKRFRERRKNQSR